MDTTPPSHQSEPRNRTKSVSRLSKLRHYSEEIPSLEIVPLSPKLSPQSPPPPVSTLSPKPPYSAPLRELLLLSASPLKKSKTRLAERFLDIDDAVVEGSCGRKRGKTRNSTRAAASPKNKRRSRKRVEQEMGEEKYLGLGEEVFVKPKKKRNSGRSNKDKSIVVISSENSPRTIVGDGCNFGRFGEIINDLVMWKDVSKSSLWFGFGTLCFLSSCFTRSINFSVFSFLSQMGFLFLAVSFFSNSIRQRDANDIKSEFKLTENDFIKVGKLILPAANISIAKTSQVFSGEPSMTLKVIPFFLFGAEYGHLITLWRLSALIFFFSFTGPKLYSAYSAQLSNKVEYMKSWGLESWGACTHKKIVSASLVTAFWNLTSIRIRIFAAFLCLVIFRYQRQSSYAAVEEEYIGEGTDELPQGNEIINVENGSTK